MASVNVRINGNAVVAENGQTILQVARANGIHIPTLCYDPRLPPYGSCLVCVVEVRSAGRLLMSCTTPAVEGMEIWTESEPAVQARRAALEMLLSNHYADCRGPCFLECPANVDVQGYLALANAGMYREALELIRETNPMPLACGRVCVRYCEASCRRNDVDSPAARRCSAHRQDGGDRRGRPRWAHLRLLPGQEGPRGDHLRQAAQAGRHAPLRHPRVPSARSGSGQRDQLPPGARH